MIPEKFYVLYSIATLSINRINGWIEFDTLEEAQQEAQGIADEHISASYEIVRGVSLAKNY